MTGKPITSTPVLTRNQLGNTAIFLKATDDKKKYKRRQRYLTCIRKCQQILYASFLLKVSLTGGCIGEVTANILYHKTLGRFTADRMSIPKTCLTALWVATLHVKCANCTLITHQSTSFILAVTLSCVSVTDSGQCTVTGTATALRK